jgi:Ricin-type beta-trefoil lectin domain-like
MSIRSRTAGLMLAVAAVASLSAVAALPASASTGYYKIFVQVAGSAPAMCLQPADPDGGAGTAIVQQPCANIRVQSWAPLSLGGTSYQFLNQASGLCMDARGGAARGTPIEQWPCNTISNERWSWPFSFPDGMLPIRSQVAGTNGYCLDVPGASTAAGLRVQIYTCNGTTAQAWGIVGPLS